jgi:hypothetical protein
VVSYSSFAWISLCSESSDFDSAGCSSFLSFVDAAELDAGAMKEPAGIESSVGLTERLSREVVALSKASHAADCEKFLLDEIKNLGKSLKCESLNFFRFRRMAQLRS